MQCAASTLLLLRVETVYVCSLLLQAVLVLCVRRAVQLLITAPTAMSADSKHTVFMYM
jgi:hypothetical protein